jgi:two-component system, LuxR family, response regulator DctR
MSPAPHTTAAHAIPLVHVIDDEEVVREALAWLLRSRRLLAEQHASADAFVAWLAAREAGAARPWPDAPCCLVLDLRMPGTSGLQLFERLIEQGRIPALPVIFLTGHGDVATAVAAVKRGAFDFVEKPLANNALVDRIDAALAHSREQLARRDEVLGHQRALADLTEREREVMALVVEGQPNKRIADRLGISVRTVEVHRARVFDKMQVKSAVELANALRAGAPAGPPP